MGMVEEVKAYILASSLLNNPWVDPLLGTAGGNIFLHFLSSDTPDRSCALYQDPGKPPQLGLGGNVSWYNPKLRIENRAPAGDYITALLDAEKIRDLLLGVVNQPLSGTRYLKIMPIGEPRATQNDPNNRPLFTTEYDVMKMFSE